MCVFFFFLHCSSILAGMSIGEWESIVQLLGECVFPGVEKKLIFSYNLFLKLFGHRLAILFIGKGTVDFLRKVCAAFLAVHRCSFLCCLLEKNSCPQAIKANGS